MQKANQGKIKALQNDADGQRVQQFNATILGIHSYYKIASHISKDFADIAFRVIKNLYNRTRPIKSKRGIKSQAYEKYYGKCTVKPIFIQGVALFPIHFVQTTPPICFSQSICNYTAEGRKKIHDNLQTFSYHMMMYLMRNPVKGQSTEFNDNRISLYVACRGRCYVTGAKLEIFNMEVHHKVPKCMGGSDKYNNSVFVTANAHKLIHATTPETIIKYLGRYPKNTLDFKRLNNLRLLVGNCEIVQ